MNSRQRMSSTFEFASPDRRRNAAAIGFINLIDNLARYEQIARLQLIPLRAA